MYKTICSTFIVVALAYLFIAYPQLNNLISTSNTTSPTEEMALSSVSRGVAKKVLAIETPEGAGALVRRSIGSMNLRNLTPFLMLDHFHITKGAVGTISCQFYCPNVYFWRASLITPTEGKLLLRTCSRVAQGTKTLLVTRVPLRPAVFNGWQRDAVSSMLKCPLVRKEHLNREVFNSGLTFQRRYVVSFPSNGGKLTNIYMLYSTKWSNLRTRN